MMELSKRLQAVADLVSDGMTVADVGTDHGYIPIYLLQSGKSPRAIAMDVNEGPLLRAKEHIGVYGLSERIDVRLSDGVKKLIPGEVECVVIAGMGGALTIRIMDEGKELFQSLSEFVLQPQSELWKVRKYLCENGYCITAEDMVIDDGKYYPMMKVIKGQAPAYDAVELRYGKKLIEKKNPVLLQFLEREHRAKTLILQNLEQKEGRHILERKEEIKETLEEITDALQRFHRSH